MADLSGDHMIGRSGGRISTDDAAVEQRLEISTKRDEFRADFTWVDLVFPGMFGRGSGGTWIDAEAMFFGVSRRE